MSNNKDKLWYLAHPYSGDRLANFRKANQVAANLIERGYILFSPISMSHPIQAYMKDELEELWYTYDLLIAEKCDGLILANGWLGSYGCRLEYSYFTEQDKPILFYERFKE